MREVKISGLVARLYRCLVIVNLSGNREQAATIKLVESIVDVL